MSERQERCENCRFWERLKADELSAEEFGFMSDDDGTMECGWCRRLPPVVNPVALADAEDGCEEPTERMMYHRWLASNWPIVLYTEWCGEFQPKHETTQTGRIVEQREGVP